MGGHDHFSRNGMLDDKNECNLFYGKWGTEYSLEIFSSKTPIPAEWKLKNQFWRHIFSHISGSIDWTNCFQKNRTHPCVDSHQTCEFHENPFKTVICIVTVIIIISWKSRSAIFNVNWRTSARFSCSKVYSIERKFYGE